MHKVILINFQHIKISSVQINIKKSATHNKNKKWLKHPVIFPVDSNISYVLKTQVKFGLLITYGDL